jgi:hypothetical protein
MQKVLGRLQAEYARCDTVVVGIHVRYGGVEFAAHEPHQLRYEDQREYLYSSLENRLKSKSMSADQKKTEIQAMKDHEDRHARHVIATRNALDQRMSKDAVKLMFEWAELVGRRLAKQSDKHRILYFVASDTELVIKMAQIRFGKESVLVTPGEPQDTRVVDTATSRLKAAADWWLLGQSDALVLGRDSSYADKAVLAAMHVPVIVRCSNAYGKDDPAQNVGINKAVEGWACRPAQVLDDPQGPRAA